MTIKYCLKYVSNDFLEILSKNFAVKKYKIAAKIKSVIELHLKYTDILEFNESYLENIISILHNNSYKTTNEKYFKDVFGDSYEQYYKKYCLAKSFEMRRLVEIPENKYMIKNDLISYIKRDGIIKGTEKHNKFKEKQKLSANTTLNYWMGKTDNDEVAAKELLKNRQTTFSKEKCIDNFGEIIGIDKWNNRQYKWIASLKGNENNHLKSIVRKELWTGIENWKYELLKFFKKENLFSDTIDNVLNHFVKIEKYHYKPNTSLLKKVPKYIWIFLEIEEEFIKLKSIENLREVFNVKEISYKQSKGKYKNYMKYDDYSGKVLRSLNEILFSDLLKFYKISYKTNLKYPDSKFSYDFYLPEYEIYIELSDIKEEKYSKNMQYKIEKFNCIFLEYKEDYEEFLINLISSTPLSSTMTSINVSGCKQPVGERIICRFLSKARLTAAI